MIEQYNKNDNVKCLIVNIGDHYFGALVNNIADVNQRSPTTPIPMANKNIIGVLNSRGHIVTEINVAHVLGIEPNNTKRIKYHQLNLRENYNIPGQFDFIMLRNILIYFDPIMKKQILNKVHEKLNPNGFLLLGAAEAIYDSDAQFERSKDIKGLYTRATTRKII